MLYGLVYTIEIITVTVLLVWTFLLALPFLLILAVIIVLASYKALKNRRGPAD